MPGKEIPMRVEQLMSHPVRTCSASDMLDRAARIMWGTTWGASSSSRMVGVDGIITGRDICMAGRFAGRALWEIPVGEVMSRPVETVHWPRSVTRLTRRQIFPGSEGDSSSRLAIGAITFAASVALFQKRLG